MSRCTRAAVLLLVVAISAEAAARQLAQAAPGFIQASIPPSAAPTTAAPTTSLASTPTAATGPVSGQSVEELLIDALKNLSQTCNDASIVFKDALPLKECMLQALGMHSRTLPPLLAGLSVRATPPFLRATLLPLLARAHVSLLILRRANILHACISERATVCVI